MTDLSNFKTRVTIYEVAKVSGYSLATVSRVINKKGNVKEDTKQKILETIKKLGYKPSALAQGLAKSKTTNIGIVLPSYNYTYLSNVLSGLADIAKIYGYQTTLFLIKPERDEVTEVIDKLISSHVDGAVLFDDILTEDDLKEISKYNIPCVFIDHDVTFDNIASISLVYENAVRQIVREHYAMGSEKIYFLHLTNSGSLIEYLKNVVKEEVDALGKFGLFECIEIDDFYDNTYIQFAEHFKNIHEGFYIAPRDSISCAVTNAALDNNLSIPDDVQIMSIIGTKYSHIMRPKLSAIYIDMYEVGSIAMRMLTKMFEGTLKQKNFVFNAEVLHQASTRKIK